MLDKAFKATTSTNLKTIYQLVASVIIEIIWLTFGFKVGRIILIAMKPELDMWCYLPDVYTKFQIDISKHVNKSRKT